MKESRDQGALDAPKFPNKSGKAMAMRPDPPTEDSGPGLGQDASGGRAGVVTN
jgi:hypothetical protein